MFNETTLKNIFSDLPEDKAAYFLEVCKQYPYFSLAHFLNLKYQNISDDSSKLDMALLHFDNSYLLNKRLNEKTKESDKPEYAGEIIDNSIVDHSENIAVEDVKISGIGNIAAEIKSDFNKENKGQDLEIAFEPLHTTDYFASQ
ncbi:MAG: hypothetical protein ABIP68_07880 [Ferruginibacter sp.]